MKNKRTFLFLILHFSFWIVCERGWIRTIDPLLKRQMLYP